jgi:pimeloyl-ACP methyl ester carboxylesterase
MPGSVANKNSLIEAALRGDSVSVREHYTPEWHDEAARAAHAARQWRVASLLAELHDGTKSAAKPPNVTPQPITTVSRSRSDDDDTTLLGAFTHAQDSLEPLHPDWSLYRALPGRIVVDRCTIADFSSQMIGEIDRLGERARADKSLFLDQDTFEVEKRLQLGNESNRFFVERDPDNGEVLTENTRDLSYAYTAAGDRGPVVVFVHGVPTNREQWWPVQRIVSRWCRTLAFDLLGMGESSQPLDMPDEAWDWRYDAIQWNLLLGKLVRGERGGADGQGSNVWGDTTALAQERIILVADDWGSGPNAHFAELYGDEWLLGHVQQDPITLDGYPVSEIQAFGRLHAIFASDRSEEAKRALFRTVVGAADQTMVQIFKTMVFDQNKYNQYVLRSLKKTYVDIDYERLAARDGEDADSLTLRLNFHAIRVMAARASRLAPAQLLPYSATANPRGVEYDRVRVGTLILWGAKDNSKMKRKKKKNERFRERTH